MSESLYAGDSRFWGDLSRADREAVRASLSRIGYAVEVSRLFGFRIVQHGLLHLLDDWEARWLLRLHAQQSALQPIPLHRYATRRRGIIWYDRIAALVQEGRDGADRNQHRHL